MKSKLRTTHLPATNIWLKLQIEKHSQEEDAVGIQRFATRGRLLCTCHFKGTESLAKNQWVPIALRAGLDNSGRKTSSAGQCGHLCRLVGNTLSSHIPDPFLLTPSLGTCYTWPKCKWWHYEKMIIISLLFSFLQGLENLELDFLACYFSNVCCVDPHFQKGPVQG